MTHGFIRTRPVLVAPVELATMPCARCGTCTPTPLVITLPRGRPPTAYCTIACAIPQGWPWLPLDRHQGELSL